MAAFRPPFWEGHLLRRPSLRKLLRAGHTKFSLQNRYLCRQVHSITTQGRAQVALHANA